MKHLISFFVFSAFLLGSELNAQIVAHASIRNGDTIPEITMREYKVFDEMGEKGKERRREYRRLVYNTKKVMPYARAFAKKMREMNAEMEDMNKREQKRYLKSKEKEIKESFEAKLKDLTYSQGHLLIKLIDRETGYSSYDLIKSYKSGFTAIFWQSAASLFGMNLKNKYDAEQEQALEKVLLSLGYE